MSSDHMVRIVSNLDYLFDHKYTDAQYEYQLKQEGREEGREEDRKEIVIEMIRNGYSVEEISKITKLSPERIQEIKSEMDESI